MKLLLGTCNFNSLVFTKIWLKTLKKSIERAIDLGLNSSVSVVVVDNSTEELEKISPELEAQYPNYKFIKNNGNVGCAAGWNQIIKDGYRDGEFLFDYYMPTNNDLYFTENWVHDFIEGLRQDKNKDYGFLYSMTNDLKEHELTGIIETVQVENGYWNGLRPEADDVDSVEQLEVVLKATYAGFSGIENFAKNLKNKYGLKIREMHPKSSCFALSKECIQKVGLFEEFSVNGVCGIHEDADYSQRVKMAGLKFGVILGPFVHHFSMMSRTKGSLKESWWLEAREKAFQEKWSVSSKEMEKIPLDKGFKLDIGSGPNPRADGHWIHMDSDPRWNNVEYLQDVSEPFLFKDEEFIEIYASNVLEHIEHQKVPAVLFEWCRVLRSGGKIHLRVPNFAFAASKYLKNEWVLSFTPGTELNIMHLVMGGDYPGYQHVHKSLFDEHNLRQLMSDCGIINVKNVSDENSWELRMEGIKQ